MRPQAGLKSDRVVVLTDNWPPAASERSCYVRSGRADMVVKGRGEVFDILHDGSLSDFRAK